MSIHPAGSNTFADGPSAEFFAPPIEATSVIGRVELETGGEVAGHVINIRKVRLSAAPL